MHKILTKKQIKRLPLITMSTILIAILFGTFSLVFSYETHKYKPCEKFEFNGGGFPIQYIKGIETITGNYLNVPSLSCKQKIQENDVYYEESGSYLGKKYCEPGKDGKAYISTSYELCPFGCLGDTCIPKCESPYKDNIFVKGLAYGFDAVSTKFIIPGNPPQLIHQDYCTTGGNDENLLLSRYVAKRGCDENNYVNTTIIECSDICFDGACQKSDFRYCGDSDQDDQGKLPGVVTYYDPAAKEAKTEIDSCLDNKTVTEYFCGKDNMSHRLILTCRYSCVDGRCLQQ